MGSRPHPLLTLSAPQATWLFFRKAGDLKAEEQESLRQLRQASPHLESAYQLVEAFLHMVRERRAEQFDTWLTALQASGLEAFTSFVTGVLQDKDAVLAGLSLPWSNGPLEGMQIGLNPSKEVWMDVPKSICSSFVCSITAKRVRRERKRGRSKGNSRFLSRNLL